ncbi:hypothetical protein [Methylobacterium fujisawaense]|uniref:hypothetical protein n=1 Tax=Methylobacterium fujisawaense TaxID=107400 RepID=UPI00244C25FD|nr:hypothetical protein [Methylobacterium fujisawaense]MDH3031062.1 hypothetical protein [Methylobacterium fujisawaense]
MTVANTRNHPQIIEVRLSAKNQRTGPIVYPPSSREIARRKAKAEDAARIAAAAQALARQVQPALRPPPGRLFAADPAALLLRGPLGGIGTTDRMARTLAPLAAGGRHPVADLIAAGSWRDEEALREALAGLGPKLAILGLRICWRKAGLRIAKLKPAAPIGAA